METVRYVTEFGQNEFGYKTGNRAKKIGVYRCRSCGEESTIWLDHGRLPTCHKCQKPVVWEYLHSKIDDVSQAGRDAKET